MGLKEAGLPPQLFIAHQSYLSDTPLPYFDKVQADHMIKEIALGVTVKQKLTFDVYKDIVKSGEARPSWEDARLAAAVETATLTSLHPELLFTALEFPSLFRFLRTIELAHGLKRGGKTFFVGSGETIPEYFANYLALPSNQQIGDFFRSQAEQSTDLILLAESTKLAGVVEQIRQGAYRADYSLLEGQAYAVDPVDVYHDLIGKLARFMNVNRLNINYQQLTLGQALSTQTIPDNCDRVIVHRADPRIFSRNFGLIAGAGKNMHKLRKEKDQRMHEDVQKVLGILLNKLISGGSLIITVGIGNSNAEQDTRRQLIDQVKKRLHEMRQHVIDDIPINFDSEFERFFFHDSAVGMVGAVVVTRK